ncbi:hypothetical protein [Ktedonosporobacter rubrisoli]|nr:hypothetical protein [Ktedonosporobacter rubrisoli]
MVTNNQVSKIRTTLAQACRVFTAHLRELSSLSIIHSKQPLATPQGEI